MQSNYFVEHLFVAAFNKHSARSLIIYGAFTEVKKVETMKSRGPNLKTQQIISHLSIS